MNLVKENESKIIELAISKLADAGWTLISGDDGDGVAQNINTLAQALELVHSVDESWLCFINGNGAFKSIYLIVGNGNDGLDVITDYSAGESFDIVMDAVLDEVDSWEAA